MSEQTQKVTLEMTHEPSTSRFGAVAGTHRSYAVEVRSTYPQPTVLPCGQIVDKEWRLFPARLLRCDRPDHPYTFTEANGVPVQNFCYVSDELNLMDFGAAYALATVIHAQANNSAKPLGALCLETRLIEVEVKYSYETKVKRTGDPINLYELQRSATWEGSE